MKIIVGISGASGVIYGLRLCEELLKTKNIEVYLIISDAGKKVLQYEINEFKISQYNEIFSNQIFDYFKSRKLSTDNLFVLENDKIDSKIASGSFITDGMIILPCSMATVAATANGISNNLIQRAADVIIKEKRKLVLSPREMPFNQIHLENLLKLSKIGVDIVVPTPGFYHNPTTVEDMIDHVVGKILDLFKINHSLYNRWQGGDS